MKKDLRSALPLGYAKNWKSSTIRLLVLTVGFCVTTVLSSCSGDDKFSQDVRIEFDPDLQETIHSIMERSKSDMKAADFKDLTSLAEALKNDTAKVNWTGSDNNGMQEVIASLQSLLDSFFANENPSTFDKSWNFSNMSKTLLLAVNVGLAFEKNADGQYSGNRNYSSSMDVVVNDTLTYKISYSTEKDTGVSLSEVGNVAHRKLTIDRNGSMVLVIDTNQDLDASMNGYHINATQQSVSSIDYKDMKFSIVRTQYNTDSVASNLVYSKDGSEVVGIRMKSENDLSLEKLLQHKVMCKGELEASISNGFLGLKCDVANMNKFYMASLGLAGIGIAGSSKETCQIQADAFNAVVNSKLSIFGVEQGLVTMEPVASDSVSNVYRPELVLQLFPIDEDSEKIILKDFMALLGLSFKDIFNSLIGQ